MLVPAPLINPDAPDEDFENSDGLKALQTLQYYIESVKQKQRMLYREETGVEPLPGTVQQQIFMGNGILRAIESDERTIGNLVLYLLRNNVRIEL